MKVSRFLLFSLLATLAVVVASGIPSVCAAGPNSEPTWHAATDDQLGYLEQVVGADDPTGPLPLVILIHGLGDRPQDFIRLLSGFQGPARIIAPQGPIRHGPGYSWFNTIIKNGAVTGLDSQQARTSAQRLLKLAKYVESTRPTVGKPIVTGFSQGGVLSFAIALHHPQDLSLAVPISGLLPADLWPSKRADADPTVPIRALHGAEDRLVPVGLNKVMVRWLKKLGYDVEATYFDGVAHQLSSEIRQALSKLLSQQVKQLRSPAGGSDGPGTPDDTAPPQSHQKAGEAR